MSIEEANVIFVDECEIFLHLPEYMGDAAKAMVICDMYAMHVAPPAEGDGNDRLVDGVPSHIFRTNVASQVIVCLRTLNKYLK